MFLFSLSIALIYVSISIYFFVNIIRIFCLKVIVQLTNVKIVRPDVVIHIRTRDLEVMCKFNFKWITTSSKKSIY